MSETITRPRQQSETRPAPPPDLVRELRLAVVCYGGVSLAVYMHGITVELQSLVAASAVFRDRPSTINPFDPNCTEYVYWEALDAMARDTADGGASIRIVLDIISGTSAGGINGIVLAKALAMGVKQDPLRTVWFDKASIVKLLARLPRSIWSKGPKPSAWAPLNGRLMTKWAFDALQAMNTTPVDGPAAKLSLVPDDNELELFVTTTDCAGLRRTIGLYDPQSVHDLEYRQVLRFSSDPLNQLSGSLRNGNDWMLTMAARATSSFPGAFPPVTIAEIAAITGQPCDPSDRQRHFNAYELEGAKPESAFFLDGGVLNNRPFDHAVDAIMTRSSGREVERRLLFIEPHPIEPVAEPTDGPAPARPSWARTVAAALTGIPRHQPIADALDELARQNVRAGEIRQLIALTEPSVFDLIEQTARNPKYREKMDPAKAGDLSSLQLDEIEIWANAVADAARTAVGVCYGPYEVIKVGEVLADLSEGICVLMHYPATSRHAALVTQIVQRWAQAGNLMLNDALAKPRRVREGEPTIQAYRKEHKKRKEFLQTYDMNFRIRRLRFLVRSVNDTYAECSADRNLRPTLDNIKAGLYALILQLRQIKSGIWLMEDGNQALMNQLQTVFAKSSIDRFLDAADDTSRGYAAKAAAFIDAHHADLDLAFTGLEAAIKARYAGFYQSQKAELQALLALQHDLPPDLLKQMLARYIGFTYWDAILYPLIAMSGIREPDQVEVMRVSPNDTTLLWPQTALKRLKGISAFHFGAFLKRSYRENDFLWGRLDGVERLLGVLSSIEKSGLPKDKQQSLAWQGFQAVLDHETSALKKPSSKALIAGLQQQVKKGLALIFGPSPSSSTTPTAGPPTPH